MSAFAICVVAVFYVARVSGASTSGFPSLEQLSDDGLTRQLVGLDVRQWLFPAVRFTCDGYVTKWIFRATNETTGGIDNNVLPPFLPLMETFEELLTGSMIGPSFDYGLKSTTGSEQELQGSGPVYEYVLQSPVEVQEDDTFGIRTLFPGGTDGAWRLRLEMLEVAPGTAPTSYPKDFSAVVFDTDFNIIPTNNNLIPLVTAVISIPRGGGTTSLVFPQPTPTPATSSRMSTPPSSQTTVQASGTAPGPVQTPTTPRPTGPPGPVQMPTTPQPTGPTEEGPATPPDGSSTPGTPPPDTSGSGKDTDNAGAIAAGIIVPLVVLAAVAVVVAVVLVIVVRRRRYRKEELKKGAETTPGYTNQLYGGDSIRFNNPSGYVTATSHQINNTEGEYEFVEPHDYAVPDTLQGGPDEYVEAYPAPHAALGLPRAQNSFVSPYIVPTTDRERSSTTPSTVWPGQIDPYADPFETASNRSGSLTVVRRTSSTLKRESEDIYEVPATEETALYEQIKRIDIGHIPRNSLKLTDHLGSGHFGTVSKGEWQSPEGLVEVAVKMLKEGTDHVDKIKFLQEAAMVGQFNHHNVVKLYGMVISGEPKMMVLELLSKGDLREHLLSLRPEKSNEVDEELPHTLLSYCRQIASGMSHLAMKAFVHRDLAARNVLVSEDGTCKIADFGMSCDLMNESYYVSHGGKIPVKWTAPEALQYKKYSTASDVWSFGAVVYEIWSLGHKPFEGYTNGQAMSMVDSGVRLPPPPGCPRAIYELMIKCWHPKSSERPDSGTIVQSLSRSDMKLLKWSEEDKGVHPEASRLGAELEVAVELYKDLQDSYLNYSQEE